MDRVKNYSGTISEDTATKTVKQYYGIATSNYTAKKSKTELLNNKIREFLTECGADAKHDGDFLWINGVPMTFLFGSTNYYSCFVPFQSTAFLGNANYSTIFSGVNYNFKLRLLGEPTSAFVLLISTNYTTPTFNNGFNMTFYKAENILSGRESRIYGQAAFSSNTFISFRAIDLEDDGSPVDIGRSAASAIPFRLETLAVDFNNNKNRFPLVEWMPNFFKVSGCYYDLVNDPLPKASNVYLDSQTFIKIGGNVYYKIGRAHV